MSNRRRRAKLEPGKVNYASTNRGLALLDEAIEQIALQEEYANKHDGKGSGWYQDDYRCGSGMCLAGWVAQLAGGEWLYSADSFNAGVLKAEPDDNPDDLYGDSDGCHAHDRAVRLLGPDVTEDEADRLFEGWLSLEMIRDRRDDIADRLANA